MTNLFAFDEINNISKIINSTYVVSRADSFTTQTVNDSNSTLNNNNFNKKGI